MKKQRERHSTSGDGQNERNGDESELHTQSVLSFPIGCQRVIARNIERVPLFCASVDILWWDWEGFRIRRGVKTSMKTTDLYTSWLKLSRLEMRKLVWERQPWKRHNQVARCYAYRRCSEDAEHNAAVLLGYSVDDLRALRSQFEVGEIGGAETSTPSDTNGLEEGSKELPVLDGGVCDGDPATVPHPAKIDSATLRVC